MSHALPLDMIPVLCRLAPSMKWRVAPSVPGAFIGEGHGMIVTVSKVSAGYVLTVYAGPAEMATPQPITDDNLAHLHASAAGWVLTDAAPKEV